MAKMPFPPKKPGAAPAKGAMPFPPKKPGAKPAMPMMRKGGKVKGCK